MFNESLCTSINPGSRCSPPPSTSADAPGGCGPTSTITPERTTIRASSTTRSGSTARTCPRS
ncbi:hypothetical protein [Saccharomonospora sp. CUA-673]|uniref:hypothetical protein n=1 Tax=Saccharomonospora sp. CUA-673 TaxID=1904969 RepID=UPI001C9E9C59|nr:hypothetical protein [Saccharomonospora sp. CUA-673]